MATLGKILIPPTPKDAASLPDYKLRVAEWTRQCEQSVRTIESFLRQPSTSGGALPTGGTVGQVLEKNSSTDNDASWKDVFAAAAPLVLDVSLSTLTLPVASATTDGYLSAADWVMFNAGGSITFGNLTETTSSVLAITGGSGAVVGSGTAIQVRQSSASQAGYLSAADWSAFNGKQAALSFGNLAETTSSILTIFGGTGAVVGSGTTITVAEASGSVSGYLSSTDWITFNNKLAPNTVIAATHTKISYDSNGLITAGVDATTTDISEGTNLYYTDARVRANRLDQLAAPTSDVAWGSVKITNLSDPSNPQDAATKAYVDAVASGLSPKASCRLATTVALPTATYANGASGIGATLTGLATGVLTIDGSTVNLDDRVLVQTQAAQLQNGIYTCTVAGAMGVAFVLTRTIDNDTPAEVLGAFTFIETGTVNASAGFVSTNITAPTIGMDAITFTQFSGAGEVSVTSPLTKTGNILGIPTGNLTETTSSVLTISGGAGAQIGTGTTIAVTKADATHSGYLSSTDWNAFNNAASVGRAIMLCAAFTPSSTGADTAEVVVPFATDGTSVLTWSVRRLILRVQTAGGAPSVTIEVSTITGGFSAGTIGTVTLSSGASEGATTSGLTTSTVQSGNKLRFNVATLATALNWTIIVELSNP